MKVIKKLEENELAWVDMLLEVLWSYRTTTQIPTRETPFSLAFGAEAMILAKVGSINVQVKHYNPRLNEEGMKLSLDLLPEWRDKG